MIEKKLNVRKKGGKTLKSYVWMSTGLDELRDIDCLCLNCDRKNDEQPYSSCHLGQKIYELCVENNSKMAMTQCGAKDKKGTLLYKPVELPNFDREDLEMSREEEIKFYMKKLGFSRKRAERWIDISMDAIRQTEREFECREDI